MRPTSHRINSFNKNTDIPNGRNNINLQKIVEKEEAWGDIVKEVENKNNNLPESVEYHQKQREIAHESIIFYIIY